MPATAHWEQLPFLPPTLKPHKMDELGEMQH